MDATAWTVVDYIREYWPLWLFLATMVASVVAAVHAAMTKHDVRAAIGWVALIIFSPLFGTLFYLVAGINRVRYSQVMSQRDDADPLPQLRRDTVTADIATQFGHRLDSLRRLGDDVSPFPLAAGNRVTPLAGGDAAYPAMLAAIQGAQQSVALSSYIFDNDRIGQQMADALIAAMRRGVEVRVLIDAIGARYSHPPITHYLQAAGVRVALFMSPLLGLHLTYANMRSHRKLLVVDGEQGFAGGMNIRAAFATGPDGTPPARDVHFHYQGPVVGQLMATFAHDWQFTTHERLRGALWFPDNTRQPLPDGVPVRVVQSGPDRMLGSTQTMLLGALAVAKHSVRFQSPYFLPDGPLIAALTTAARRGIAVDIVIPGVNNLRLVDYAMTAQLDQLVARGCRVWRAHGPFDHAKLCTVDESWSYVGSSNLDSRSLRLNFEMDCEVYDNTFNHWVAEHIDATINTARPETLETLRNRPFLVRLRNRCIWLASPYL